MLFVNYEMTVSFVPIGQKETNYIVFNTATLLETFSIPEKKQKELFHSLAKNKIEKLLNQEVKIQKIELYLPIANKKGIYNYMKGGKKA